MIKQVCEVCGKSFASKAPRKYCCKKCRMEAIAKNKEKKGQLCWNCKNTNENLCSWFSKEMKPIDGWTAKEVLVKEEDGYVRRTYKITACPNFNHI